MIVYNMVVEGHSVIAN